MRYSSPCMVSEMYSSLLKKLLLKTTSKKLANLNNFKNIYDGKNVKIAKLKPFKAFNLNWCILCKGNEETSYHLFLHCLFSLELWHILFTLTRMVWVHPRNCYNMMTISYTSFRNSTRDKTL